MNELDRRYHEVSNLFPLMDGEEYELLKADIAANGLLEPIWLHPDQSIIDGRNRHRACIETETPMRFRTWNGKGSLVSFVVSLNLHRRHLNSGQCAAIALDAEAMIAKEIAEQEQQRKRGETTYEIFHKSLSSSRDALQEAADLFGTNRHYVSDAKRLQQEAPDLLERVKAGEITMPTAIREARRTAVIENLNDLSVQEVKRAEGVYDVIVIDPPWPIEKIEREVRPNQVGLDYPTMSLDELAGLELPAAENCHVWLWATQKFLPTAFLLLEDWGLRYVCTFTWHKPGGFQPIGLPQYNSEFVLYARKGTPLFVDTKSFNTCFDAPRGAHSEKPQAFYDTVMRVTAGRRLDMFNRRVITGFDGWGQEANG